jgi:hypothetical protein
MPGAMTRPRHRDHCRPVLRAAHPRRIRLQPHRDRAEIQAAPPAPALTPVIPAGPSAAAATPAPGTLTRAHMRHHKPHLLIEDDLFDDRVFHTQQPLEYTGNTHAVS